MKRVFIAVDISEEARQVAAIHADELRRKFHDVRVSWVRPANMHITLKFIGDRNDNEIAAMTSSIERVAGKISPFDAALSAPIAFGSGVLVIEVADPSGSFAELSTFLEAECERLGIVREKRSFRPHITIGRIRSQKGVQPLIAEHRHSKIEPAAFEVDAITLYESNLSPAGSVYIKLASIPFGGR